MSFPHELGQIARVAGVPLSANPYSPSFAFGIPHRAWERGWLAEDAVVRAEEIVANARRAEAGS